MYLWFLIDLGSVMWLLKIIIIIFIIGSASNDTLTDIDVIT